MSIKDDVEKIKAKLKKDDETEVNVAFFGQPGAGKSSLINKLLGLTPSNGGAKVGVETDTTVTATPYEKNGIILWDLPGYGTKKFENKDEFYKEFKVSAKDLFICVTQGKLTDSDIYFFKKLKQDNKICIFVVNKAESLHEDGCSQSDLESRKQKDIQKQVDDLSIKVLFTSCRNNTGIDELNKEILSKLKNAKKERWTRNAKAYSEELIKDKIVSAKQRVTYSSAMAAANGFNPIPGVNIAVDISVMVELFLEIRKIFDINDSIVASLGVAGASAGTLTLAREIIQLGTKEGIKKLVIQYAGRMAIKNVSSFIPLIGGTIASSINFATTKYIGNEYVDKCALLSKKILEEKLNL